MDYVNLCTDAPSSFALGTGLGIFAIACGNCNVIVEGEGGFSSQAMPIRLWQALVGNSGQRKSKVMDLGVGLLQRTGNQFLMPDDASVEAWHDALCDQPISLMHQEELSSLFDAQQRSYSTGLQGWMLKLWSGTPKDRKTKAGGLKVVERPRLNILGAIPPDVFFKKTKATDWRSGFLPRFLYWGGMREEWSSNAYSAPKQEAALAELLRAVHFKSDGDVVIPAAVSKVLSDWYFTEVEELSADILEDTYAGLLRLQEAGCVIAALVALSQVTKVVRPGAGRRVVVTQSDMETTVNILRLCKRTIESISSRASQSAISVSEDSISQLLSRHLDGLGIKEIADRLRISHRECRSHLNDLLASQTVTVTTLKTGNRGRPATVFKLA
jgi:hypothetical protein